VDDLIVRQQSDKFGIARHLVFGFHPVVKLPQQRNQGDDANPEQPGARRHPDLATLLLVSAVVVVFIFSH